MTRQRLILFFPKTICYLQFSKTVGAILSETHDVFTDFTGLIVFSLWVHSHKLHEGRDLVCLCHCCITTP